ncbi:golgin-45-like [Branchiostoma lanceolatum]|uniref:golgin-45-like n=1 Tax=Branchiostoma lanceolatum TaxID=7740 RepID=UPI0034563F41
MDSAPFAFVKPQAHSSQNNKKARTHGGGNDSTLNAMRRSQLSRTRSETRIFGQVQGFQKPKLNDVPLSSAKITQFKAMEERGSGAAQQGRLSAQQKAKALQVNVDHHVQVEPHLNHRASSYHDFSYSNPSQDAHNFQTRVQPTPNSMFSSQQATVISVPDDFNNAPVDITIARSANPLVPLSTAIAIPPVQRSSIGVQCTDDEEHLQSEMSGNLTSEMNRSTSEVELGIQSEVNKELKKLLVASVGSDLQYQFERMAREKAQLSVDHDNVVQQHADLSEEVERLSIQCDVWRSKFLGSRTQVSQLIDLRNAIYQQFGKAQEAIDDIMQERVPIRKEMVETYRLLDQLVKALRWGKPQPLQQAANPRNMKELVQANHRLVSAVSAQLLGNIKPMNSANQETVESGIGLTTAEAAAAQVLNMNFDLQLPSPESAAPVGKMSGRFHPQHKYEEITVNCCDKCKGEIKVV